MNSQMLRIATIRSESVIKLQLKRAKSYPS
jgi:hypothetical protein